MIAQFSTKYFETPIRTNRSLTGRRALILGITCASVPFTLSFGFDELADSGLGLKVNELSVKGENSFATKLGCTFDDQQMVMSKSCKLKRSTNKDLVLLVGDSTAGAISDGVYLATKKAGLDFVVVYGNGCPYQNKPNLSRTGCAEFVNFREKLLNVKTLWSIVEIPHPVSTPRIQGGLKLPMPQGKLENLYITTI